MIDYKGLNEIIFDIISDIHANIPEADTKIGTFLRDAIINPFSNSMSKIYTQMKKLEMGQSILTAIGEDLEALAANFFIYKKSGTKSIGRVRFYIENTLESTTNDSPVYQDIYIPMNTKIIAKYSNGSPSIQFETTTSTTVNANTIKDLPRDNTGYRYVEVLCKSINTGINQNIGKYEINALADNVNGISSVSNYEKFRNGTNAETDESLALRTSLALFANNICTKNGYLSFLLKQPQVIDLLIVGAGDKEMERDKITITNKDGELETINTGGCVDIYVRTNTETDDFVNVTVENEDVDTDGNVIININNSLEEVPIISIKSITGSRDENGNISYETYTENSEDSGFTYHVNTEDKNVNYVGSCKEKSYISFNGATKPKVGDKLTISYSYNDGIKTLQDLVDNNKVLTADILIRSADEIKVGVLLNFSISNLYNKDKIRSIVESSINTYIDGRLKMGSSIDITDIIYLLKMIDGVKKIDLNNIGFYTDSNQDKLYNTISCNQKQYIVFDELTTKISFES